MLKPADLLSLVGRQKPGLPQRDEAAVRVCLSIVRRLHSQSGVGTGFRDACLNYMSKVLANTAIQNLGL